MLKQFFLAGFTLISTVVLAQVRVIHLYSDGSYAKYELTFNDEFDHSELDRNKWMTAFPWGRHLVGESVNAESQEYHTDGNNIEIKNGILRFITKKEKVCGISIPWEDSSKILRNGLPNYRCFDYSSGMIYSHEPYGYGFYEMRFKQSSRSKGLWPNFWLFGENNEIDIFENKGERPTETHWDVHCHDGCKGKKGGWYKSDVNFSVDMNIISLEWHPGGQRWFLNGNNYKATSQPFNHKMNIIAGQAVSPTAGKEGLWVGPDASTVFPSSFEVDYVRYYKLTEEGGRVKNRKDAEIINSLKRNDTEHLKKKKEKPKKKKNIVAQIIYDSSQNTYEIKNKNAAAEINIYNTNGIFIRTHDPANAMQRQNLKQDEKVMFLIKAGKRKFAVKL